jgi:hypothetical protein
LSHSNLPSTELLQSRKTIATASTRARKFPDATILARLPNHRTNPGNSDLLDSTAKYQVFSPSSLFVQGSYILTLIVYIKTLTFL